MAEKYKDDIIGFLENEFYIPETGKPIKLEKWQKKEILKPLFYKKTREGIRQYNQALLGMCKKNGKSTLAAGVVTWFLFSGEPNGEIILAANDKDQSSWIIFNKVVSAIKMNPRLASSAQILKDEIRVSYTNTTCRVIAQDYSSASGLNASLVIFDEIWAFELESAKRFYEELTLSPARKEPLILIVSYAGYSEDSLLYELYQAGLKGNDPRAFFYWSNKNKASWVTRDYLKTQKQRLRPNTYARLHENRWTSGESQFIEMRLWDQCVDTNHHPLLPDKNISLTCGLDIGIKHDSSGIVGLYRDDQSGKVLLGCHRKWQGSPSSPVDLDIIEEYILQLHQNFNLTQVLYDPYQAAQLSSRLLKRGVRMVEFNQTIPNTVRMSQCLYDLIKGRNLLMYPDADLRKHASKAIATETPRGWRITKEKSRDKIDLIVAMSMASVGSIESKSTTGFLDYVKEKVIKEAEFEEKSDNVEADLGLARELSRLGYIGR